MSTTQPTQPNDGVDRATALLVDRALWRLSDAEQAELIALGREDDEHFDYAVGAVLAATADQNEQLPDRLYGRLEAEAKWLSRPPMQVGMSVSEDAADHLADIHADESQELVATPVVMGPLGWIGWAAAATAAVVAAMVWVGGSPDGTRGGQPQLGQNVISVAWSPWSNEQVTSETPAATGEVVWSDQAQAGEMTFVDLPELDNAVYQLWIIDAERGMEQRISGAIFNGKPGELRVPIEPQLAVGEAAAFAITIEQPGGVWVSDMSRRALIASVE